MPRALLMVASRGWIMSVSGTGVFVLPLFAGVILIVLMNARPQGLLGTSRVEIV